MGKQAIKRSAEVDVFVDSLINDGDGEERFQFSANTAGLCGNAEWYECMTGRRFSWAQPKNFGAAIIDNIYNVWPSTAGEVPMPKSVGARVCPCVWCVSLLFSVVGGDATLDAAARKFRVIRETTDRLVRLG